MTLDGLMGLLHNELVSVFTSVEAQQFHWFRQGYDAVHSDCACWCCCPSCAFDFGTIAANDAVEGFETIDCQPHQNDPALDVRP